jgi:hypothetical protein
MRSLLIRCLILNLAVLLVAGALLLWYPKDSGFTITTRVQTHYLRGGEFLGICLICLFDLAIAVYLGWRICNPR